MTEIATIIKIFMEPGLKTDGPAQATLRPGSVLNGRITDMLPNGLLQINFGKFRTQARVRFPVAKGDTLRFEVLETGDPIKLKIQNPPPAAVKAPAERLFKPEDLDALRQHIESVLQKPGTPGGARGSAGSTRQLLSRLITHLLPLSTGKQTDQLAPLIKATLANSGIFFEKRLETILLQIFKTPDRIDTGRAISHPFVTHIFDSDLKPNLLKLAALLAKPGNAREQPLAAIRKTSLKLLNQIDAEQARLTRQASIGSTRRIAAYHRMDSSLAGLPGSKAFGLPAGALKLMQQQLVRSGLWSDPDLRAVARELFNTGGLESDQYAPSAPARKAARGPDTGRLNSSRHPVEKGALQQTLSGLIKTAGTPQSRSIEQLLKSFQTYINENRIQQDPQTRTALIRLGNISLKPSSREVPTAPWPDNRSEDIKQQLRILARFIDSRPALTRQAGFARARNSGKRVEPDKLVTANSRGFAGTFSEAVSPAAPHRIAAKAAGKGMLRFTLLVDSKTAALNEKLSRIDQAIAKILSNSAAHPEGKSLAKTARAFRSLVGRHQLPVDEAVKRALTAMTAEARSSKTASPSGLKSAHPSERLQTELMVLREFIGQQRAELNETLDILKALSGRATTYADPGDWSGPEKARGADPVQVVAFTLPMEDDQKPTRLKVFYPLKKRASTETGFRISLLLSMERMGPIRADIFTRRKTLEIKFSTETEPARRYIGDHLSRLSKLLDGHFETVNLTAAVDDKTIAAFEYEDLGLSDNRLVNLKA